MNILNKEHSIFIHFSKYLGLRWDIITNSWGVILLVSVICLLRAQITAQEKIILDLESVLRLAQADNLTLQLIEDKEQLALAEYEMAKTWWMPSFYTDVGLHQLWGNAMNSDGHIFENVNRQSFAGALGLSSEIDFSRGKRSVIAKEFGYKSKVFSSRVEKNNFLLDVITSYYELVSAQVKAEAYRQLQSQGQNIIEQQELLVAEGLQYNTDLLLSKSRNQDYNYQIRTADNEYSAWKSRLQELLSTHTDFEIADENLLPVELISEELMVTSRDSIHPEYQYLQTIQLSKEAEYRNIKNSVVSPHIRFNAYTSLFGDVFENISPTHALNGNIGLSIPVAALSNKELQVKEVEQSMIENLIESWKLKTDVNIRELKNQLSTTREQITSSEKAIELSMQALSETVERQKLGLARPFEIEWAQEAVIRSKINRTNAVSDYNKKQYELYVLLGNNL